MRQGAVNSAVKCCIGDQVSLSGLADFNTLLDIVVGRAHVNFGPRHHELIENKRGKDEEYWN